MHLLKPAALVAVTVAGVALALARVPRRLPRRPRPPAGVIEWAALALVAAPACFALIGALAPEVEYDALWYHLELVKRYLADGTLLDFPCQYVSHYPMGAELMFGYGFGLADQVAAKLVHFGFGVLFVLATYRLGTQVAPAASRCSPPRSSPSLPRSPGRRRPPTSSSARRSSSRSR